MEWVGQKKKEEEKKGLFLYDKVSCMYPKAASNHLAKYDLERLNWVLVSQCHTCAIIGIELGALCALRQVFY